MLTLLLAASLAANAGNAQDLDAGVVKLVVTTDGGTGRVGSGFIVRIDSDWAFIVTASHVLKESARTGVVFSSRRLAEPAPATVVNQQHWDGRGLALLKVSVEAARAAGARALSLSTSGPPARVQPVVRARYAASGWPQSAALAAYPEYRRRDSRWMRNAANSSQRSLR